MGSDGLWNTMHAMMCEGMSMTAAGKIIGKAMQHIARTCDRITYPVAESRDVVKRRVQSAVIEEVGLSMRSDLLDALMEDVYGIMDLQIESLPEE